MEPFLLIDVFVDELIGVFWWFFPVSALVVYSIFSILSVKFWLLGVWLVLGFGYLDRYV